MHLKKILLFVLLIFFYCISAFAQTDSIPSKKRKTNIFSSPDSGAAYHPRVATIRSAILPGWGQITNKKYWKLPIVYGALGVTTGILFYNIKQYKEARNAYINATDGNLTNDYLIPDPYFSVRQQPDAIRTFRNQVRQNVDYSALFILFFWGLNVVDATVDAHLKTFDVSPDLSIDIKPGHSPMANTNGVSLILNIGKRAAR